MRDIREYRERYGRGRKFPPRVSNRPAFVQDEIEALCDRFGTRLVVTQMAKVVVNRQARRTGYVERARKAVQA